MNDQENQDGVSQELSLEEAIVECLRATEADDCTDREAMISRFPRWQHELREFFGDWEEMERLSSGLSSQRQTLTLDGSNARYFGDYELLEEIGMGGMGVIYKARQISLDRVVALKMLHGARHDRERFRMEAESAAGLNHPNIVSILESGEQRGRLFFTMQYIDGCNLKEYLDRLAVSADDAAKITETIARAVHFAHQRGILHRDLKPANVLMDAHGQPHIADFGLAKQIERDTEITRTGTILGTPGYMAREQASGKTKNLTTATDVYGLGAILYALLTGDAPFTGESSLEILRRVIDEPPTSPRVFRRDLNRDIETICMKCLEKTPALRYPSADRLADDLSRYLAKQPVTARPVSALERLWRWCRRNPLTASLTAAVIVLLLATSIVSVVLAISQYRRNELLLDVSDAKFKQKKALDVASRTLDDLYVATGMMHVQSNRVGEGVLWLSEAAKLTKNEPEKLRAQLISCQSWLREHPLPIAAMVLGQGFDEAERHGPQNEIRFRPGATERRDTQLLCKSGKEYFVWSYDQNSLWHLNSSYPDVSCVAWNPNGDWLVLGAGDGTVRFVDPDFRTVGHQVDLHDGITHLAFSGEKTMAIASGNVVQCWNLATQEPIGEELIHTEPVIRVLFDENGDRLVAVTSGSNMVKSEAHAYSVVDDQIDKLFATPCQHLDNLDIWRPIWPAFVGRSGALMVREDRRFVRFLDAVSGETLGTHNLTGGIYSSAFTTDGMHTLTGGDKSARLCRIASSASDNSITLKEVARLEHPNRVFATDINRQGIIVTGGGDGAVRLWSSNRVFGNATTSKSIGETSLIAVLPHQTSVSQAVFSTAGTLLATAQTDGLIRIWSVPDFQTNGQRVAPTRNKGGAFAKLAGRSHWMISGMNKWTGNVYNAAVHLHSARDGQAVVSVREQKPKGGYYHVLDAACSTDLRQIATVHASFRRSGESINRAGQDAGSLRIWSFSDGSPLHNEPLPMPSEPRSVAFHPRGGQLAVCTARMEVVLVDTETKTIQDVLKPVDRMGKVMSRQAMFPSNLRNGQLLYSPDGDTIVAWGDTDGLWVWDVPRRTPRYGCVENEGKRIVAVEFSSDSRRIALACGDHHVARVLDINTGEPVLDDWEHAGHVYSARFSPDGNWLLTGCGDGRARVFDLQSEQLVTDKLEHDLNVTDAVFSPNARYILTVGDDNRLKVWHVSDGRLALKPMPVADHAAQILVSPDSSHAIVAGGMPEIIVFDLSELHSEPRYELPQLTSLSELLATGTINNGSLLHLSTRQWYERWLKYTARYGHR